MRLRNISILMLALLLVAAMPVWAQEVTANIMGTVKDPTGAVIAGATVTITNTDKGIVIRTIKTDESGTFTAPMLPIGHYAVTGEMPGFKKLTEKGIVLNVNDKRTVILTLPVGAAGESVSIEANALQVETQSAASGGLVSGTQIRELSLNGRYYASLLTLVPGVTYNGGDQLYVGNFLPSGTANTLSFSINGGRTSQNNWMVDGNDNVDRGSALTLSTFPSVDAIAEFKLLKGSYDPEFGRNGGGQVNVITRSGTSTFHGAAYEFWRNDILNANTWFNKHVTSASAIIPRPVLRYNNFGWTLGGPVYIPGVYNTKKDKTFFFFSQEYRRYITYSNPTSTVPTADERNGIFAAPICTQWSTNTSAGTCLTTGTSIPAASMSPLAKQYLQDIWANVPLPNPAVGDDPHTLHAVWSNLYNFREELLRIDHIFNQHLSISGKMTRDSIPTTEPGGIFGTETIPGVAITHTNSPGHQYNVRATGTISPTFLIEGGYAYNYSAIVSSADGTTLLANSPDIHATLPFAPVHPRVPNVTLSGGTGIAGVGPYLDYNFNHNYFGNVTKIFGSHTVKGGVSFNHYRKTENNTGGTEGSFGFLNVGKPAGSAATNYMMSFGNFLLGHASSFSQSAVDITPDVRQNSIEFYGQDAWRLKPNLTLTYGARWSIFRQVYDAKNQITNFDPRAYDPAKAPCIGANGTPDTSLVGGKPVSVCNPNYDPWNGFYIEGKTSPFGSKVTNENMHDIAPRIGIAWDPWKDGKTSVRAGFGMFYDTILVGTVEQDVLSNPYLVNSQSVTNTSFDNPMSGTASSSWPARQVNGRVPAPSSTPYTEQYSFDIQRELPAGFLLDMGYYGSQAHHLIGIMELNQALPNDYLTKLPRCTATVTTNCWGSPTVAAINSTQSPILNLIRPYLGYSGVSAIESIFNSNYNSLQVQLQKRFKSGSLVNFAYTWSKALTDNQTDRSSAPQNSFNIHGDYGPMQQDRTHVFTANWVYLVPFFREQKGVVGHILGGWEFSGVANLWTGLPLTVTTTSVIDPTGQGCKVSTSPCGIRPNLIGDPNAGAPRTFLQWFNTSAFQNVPVTAIVPAGGYLNGSSGRGVVRSPGLVNFNMSVFRNIKITERVTTQLRLESFNTLNHTNYDSVDVSLGSSTFGKITGTRSPRQVQLGLKVNF